jgi:hypothetical protein
MTVLFSMRWATYICLHPITHACASRPTHIQPAVNVCQSAHLRPSARCISSTRACTRRQTSCSQSPSVSKARLYIGSIQKLDCLSYRLSSSHAHPSKRSLALPAHSLLLAGSVLRRGSLRAHVQEAAGRLRGALWCRVRMAVIVLLRLSLGRSFCSSRDVGCCLML